MTTNAAIIQKINKRRLMQFNSKNSEASQVAAEDIQKSKIDSLLTGSKAQTMTKADGRTSIVPNSLVSKYSKAPSNLSRLSKKTPLDAMFKADVMSTKEKNLSKI